MLGVSQSRGLKLFGREIIFEEFQPMCCWYLNVRDRQTDRRTDGRTDGRLTVALPRSALASRGKKRYETGWRTNLGAVYSGYFAIKAYRYTYPLPPNTHKSYWFKCKLKNLFSLSFPGLWRTITLIVKWLQCFSTIRLKLYVCMYMYMYVAL